MEDRSGEAPVFVKIDEYKDVLDVLELIRNKLQDARETLGNLDELKNEEDSELELWKSTLHEIERKVDNIDRTLLDPEHTR